MSPNRKERKNNIVVFVILNFIPVICRHQSRGHIAEVVEIVNAFPYHIIIPNILIFCITQFLLLPPLIKIRVSNKIL